MKQSVSKISEPDAGDLCCAATNQENHVMWEVQCWCSPQFWLCWWHLWFDEQGWNLSHAPASQLEGNVLILGRKEVWDILVNSLTWAKESQASWMSFVVPLTYTRHKYDIELDSQSSQFFNVHLKMFLSEWKLEIMIAILSKFIFFLFTILALEQKPHLYSYGPAFTVLVWLLPIIF